MSERRKAHGFKAERQAHFSKKVRTNFLDEGRKKKDVERARMEAYRKLCAAEGVQSKRLEEYDRTREEATDRLRENLEEVDYNQSLTNNEKKKRKYNLKRKFASTTMTELVEKKKKKYNAVTGVEEMVKRREEDREAKRVERERRDTEKAEKIQARSSRNALFSQRTKKGQPLMSSRVESLLQRMK